MTIPAGRKFQKVPVSTRIRGTTLRNPPEATVSPTGLTGLNVAGSEEVVELALESGLDPQRLGVAFGVDEAAQTIAVYVANPDTPGTAPVKQNKKNRTFNLYLQELFDKVPKLRPTAKRRCPITRTVDADGAACLVISLNASLRTGTAGRREESGTESTSKEAQSK